MATSRKSKLPTAIDLRGTIESCHASVFAVRWDGKALDPGFEIRGNLESEVKGTREFAIEIHPADPNRPATRPIVGVITATKPCLTGSLDVPQGDFAVLVAFGASGRLTHLHLSIDPPRYGSADIHSSIISTEAIQM